MVRTLIGVLLTTAVLAVAVQAKENPVELTPAQAYNLGLKALATGRPDTALAVANALLERDETDPKTLILKANSERNLGRFDMAATTAQAAWKASRSTEDKYASAMIAAQALSSAGSKSRAQLWLRRAVDVAPDDGMRALAIRDFRFVRARNPWATELNFDIAPSSNINNGSARETTRLYGLPFEFQLSEAAQALEGIQYSASVATRYRFSQGATYAHDAVFQVSHRSYTLGADAKARAPGVSGSDFAFSQASVGYIYRNRSDTGPGPYTLSATAGQSWYGGAEYFSYLRLGGTQKVRLGDRADLSFSAAAERQFGDASSDADNLRGDLRLTRQLNGAIGSVALSLGHTDSQSDTDVSEFTEWRTGIDFSLARPVAGAQVSFGLNWRQRDFPRSRQDPAGRVDREISARVDMVFSNIDRYGFNPVLSVQSAWTDSNIGLYDSETLGVSLGIQSAF